MPHAIGQRDTAASSGNGVIQKPELSAQQRRELAAGPPSRSG